MQNKIFRQWKRLEHAGRAIYIQPETPDWLVPTDHGDQLLQALTSTEDLADAVRHLQRPLPAPVRKPLRTDTVSFLNSIVCNKA